MSDDRYSINVRNTIKDVISEILFIKPESISDEKSLAALGADSLDVIEIEMEIEKRLGFKDGIFFEDELNVNMTIDEIVTKAVGTYGEYVD